MNKFTRRLIDFFNSEKITYYVDQTFDDGTEDMLTVPAFLSTVPGIIVKIFVAESGKCSFAVKLGSTESEVTKNKLYFVLNDLSTRFFTIISNSLSDHICVLLGRKSVLVNCTT